MDMLPPGSSVSARRDDDHNFIDLTAPIDGSTSAGAESAGMRPIMFKMFSSSAIMSMMSATGMTEEEAKTLLVPHYFELNSEGGGVFLNALGMGRRIRASMVLFVDHTVDRPVIEIWDELAPDDDPFASVVLTDIANAAAGIEGSVSEDDDVD